MHAIPAILFIFVNVAAAHPPGEHADALDQTHIQSFATHDQNSIHVWRDERNKRDLEGWLLTVRENSVTIDLHDGGTAKIAMEDLNEHDRARAEARRIQHRATAHPSASSRWARIVCRQRLAKDRWVD